MLWVSMTNTMVFGDFLFVGGGAAFEDGARGSALMTLIAKKRGA